MKKLCIIFLLLVCATPSFCQSKYRLNINDMAQITFPGPPRQGTLIPGKLMIYGYQGIQQSYIVHAAHTKYPTNGHSASEIKNIFFDSQIKLEIDTLKGTLLYKKNIQIDGVNGVEYSYSFVTQNVKIYNYNRLVFLNEVGIDYYIMSREPLKQNDKILSDYFNSFKIIVPKKDINSL